MMVCAFCLLMWALIYAPHIKFYKSPISGAPWSFDSWGKLLQKKKKKRISSPMFLPPKNAELIFCRSHWLSKSWYSKRLRDGSMDKLLATVRTKFISSRSTKMLSGYGHSHVFLPADAKFLLQLRNLPLRQDTEWSKKIPDTYFMPVHTYTYTYTHVLPHTWKHMAAVNQNTQTCAKKIQLRTVSTTK